MSALQERVKMTSLNTLKLTCLAACIAALAGCTMHSTLPADIPVNLPEHYAVDMTEVDGFAFNHADWPKLYKDTVLNTILEKALHAQEGSNLDIAKALAQYDQAVAAATSARSSLWPILGAGSGVGRESMGSTISSSKHIGLQAKMELDLAGKLSSYASAADLEAMGAELAVNHTHKAVQAGIVNQYWLIRQLDAEINFVDSLIEARQQLIQITQSRYEFGTATGMEVDQARASLANVQRQAVTLASERHGLEQSLAILTGIPSLTIQAVTGGVQSGIPIEVQTTPSLLLTQRSDIQLAERRIEAAGMNVQVARAALFPSVSLSTSAARHGSSLSNIIDGGITQWGLGLNIDLPLFDKGYRLSQIELAKAVERERIIDYQKAIAQAFGEVNQALIDLSRLQQTEPLMDREVIAAKSAYDMAMLQYQIGRIDYSRLLDAQQAHDEASRSQVRLGYELKSAQANYLFSLGF